MEFNFPQNEVHFSWEVLPFTAAPSSSVIYSTIGKCSIFFFKKTAFPDRTVQHTSTQKVIIRLVCWTVLSGRRVSQLTKVHRRQFRMVLACCSFLAEFQSCFMTNHGENPSGWRTSSVPGAHSCSWLSNRAGNRAEKLSTKNLLDVSRKPIFLKKSLRFAMVE